MIIRSVKTRSVTAHQLTLIDLIDESINSLDERTVIAITSKIVSLCEGAVVSIDESDKEALIIAESDYYLPATVSKYSHHFTIVNNTFIAVAGIDESNGDGQYVLWPRDSQATANTIRLHLMKRFNLQELGVVITDSTSQPLRLGTTGIVLAHSGFKALRDYIGTPDIFGRPLGITRANVVNGLAAAAVLAMGEGAEQTPLCLITDTECIEFQAADPSEEELRLMHVPIEDDLFAPFITAVDWKEGGRRA